EAEQGHVGISCEVHRQARWGANGGKNRNSRRYSLLHQFVAGASADANQSVREGDQSIEKLPSDQLVDRVVSTYTFSQLVQPSVSVKQGSRMQASRALEHRLRLT